MRPNLPFLSATSNALLKPGGLLRWNKRLVKDARLLLPLTEVMKIDRLTSLLLDAPRQSLPRPRPRLRHGRRLALLFHLGLTLNLCTLFLAGSSSSSSSSPNFPNCSSPRESASVYAAYLRSHFSVSQPKALRSRARGYLTELRRVTCPVESHSSFCSLFSLAEFLAATSNLSPSTATGPDKVAYPMLKHLPRCGMDLLLYIFNLSWSSHSFLSIWKTSSIIPIHKMGRPLDSPASFRPISLTSCVSKLFERIILYRLLFFLESNCILSPHQASFRPGRSTLDQILYLSQSISDGFNKPRPGSRTILSTIDFSKAFNSVWHPSLFHKLISAGLPPCFARWTQSFLLIGALVRFIKITKAAPFESVEVFRKDPFSALYFSLFINDLPASLPSSVSCSLYADDLAIWSSSPSVPTAVEATQGALFRLERWSEYWCLALNPSKCEASFFSVDPHQANLQLNLLLLGSRLRFNPTPTFLGVTFDRTLSFTKHVSSLKAKFFPRLKALRCISASSWGPSKESLSVLYKSFLRSLLTYASPGWFPFLSATDLTKLERLHRAASRAITGCLSFSPIPLLLTEASLPPLRATLTQFTLFSYEPALRLPTSFSISGLARLGVKPRLCRSSWRALTSAHPLMLPSTCSREALVACPPCPPWNLPSFTVESTLPTPCSRSDLPLSRQGAALAHLDSLPPHDLVLWTGGSVPFPFGKGGSGVLANCSICGTEATLSFPAGPVCSSFSAEACAILHALCWSRQHQQVCHFSSLLLLSDSRSVLATLSSPPSYLKLCGRSGRNCFLSPPVLSGYNGSPDTRFSRGTTRPMSLPDGERYLRPPQSLVVSFLLSLVSTLVFSRTGGVLSLQSILTPRFPRFPLRNLCSLVMLAVSSLELAESRILPAAPVDTCPRTSLISFCTVQLRTLCAAHSLATLCLCTTSGPDPGELPGFWGSMVFRHAPIPRKGSGNQQQQQHVKAESTAPSERV